MDTKSSPLVLTKLHIPVVRNHLVSRPRLLDLLQEQKKYRVVLVCAPAGYGKTTLLADWAQSLSKAETVVVWYTLDQGDDDPIPFRAYLVAGLLQALGPLPELVQLSQLQQSNPEIDLKFILATAINVLQAKPLACVLVLDDYHVISSPVIHDALLYLIEHLPQNLHIVISSRADPPLTLARLRARCQLLEIRVKDLRFTEKESSDFLNGLMQLDLSANNLAILENRTEGWITGLQLAALSLSGRADKEELINSFSGSHHYLAEFLMDEVVTRLPEEIQTFITSTSILERLCAPLCDHVICDFHKGDGNESAVSSFFSLPGNSQATLELLEKSNLFLVRLDEVGEWYRYHHLFRDFLLTRLKRTHLEQVPALHKSACEWLEDQSLIQEASHHAFLAEDWEFAATFAEKHSFTLITQSDLSTIFEWCSRFPEEVMQRHPMLCLQQALSMAFSFRNNNRHKIEARLHQVDQMMDVISDKELASTLTDMISIVRTFKSFAPDPKADPQELLVLSQSMIASNPEVNAGQFSGFLLQGYAQLVLLDTTAAEQSLQKARQIAIQAKLFFGIVESTFHLARLTQSKGQLKKAADICLESKQDIVSLLPQAETALPAIGCLDVLLGCIQLEKNELESAEHCLVRGLDLMGGGMNPYYLMTAYLALFHLYRIHSKPLEAKKYLDKLDVIWPDVSFYTSGLRAMQQLRDSPKSFDAIQSVRHWCESVSKLLADDSAVPGLGPYGAAEVYYLTRLLWMQALIATGNGKTIQPYLQQQLDQAKTHGLSQRMIELFVISALLSDSQENHKKAQISMCRALELAQSEGYIRIYDQFPNLDNLLDKMASQSKFSGYIRRISTAISATTSRVLGQTNFAFFGQILSDREMEVLRMIAHGATNQEIAQQLVVTVGTVKSHINHILGKLDSHNRTEAVAKARQLGLLDI